MQEVFENRSHAKIDSGEKRKITKAAKKTLKETKSEKKKRFEKKTQSFEFISGFKKLWKRNGEEKKFLIC